MAEARGPARRSLGLLALLAIALTGPGTAAPAGGITTSYGYAVFGELKYPQGFAHFDYVDPDAPKGGEYRYGQPLSFDSLNMIPLLGTYPPTLQFLQDTLMEQSRDEAASFYCLVCESLTWPDDRSWVEFTLRRDVHFNDGTPLTADDVIYSAELGKGLTMPSYNRVAQIVERIEKRGKYAVRFHFNQVGNPTLLTVVALMPIAPKHYWERRDPFKPTVDIPVAVSPYNLVRADMGKTLIFERNEDYWGWGHPLRRGRFNFDLLRNDYYRDITLQNEAFKVGLNELKLVTNAYDTRNERGLPAVEAGDIRHDTLDYANGGIFLALEMNARRTFFADRRVRKAMTLAFDFEWVRRAILGGDYGRLGSNFPNSPFAATGLPDEGELRFLEPYRDSLPPEIFTEEPSLPVGGSRQAMRGNLIEARDLLREAGYRVVDGTLRDPATGRPVELTLLSYSPIMIGQVALFIKNAEKLGISIAYKSVDAAQFRHLVRNYDFDLLYYPNQFAPLPTPSAGMLQVYSSGAADTPGLLNRAGIKEPAIDDALTRMVRASDRQTVIDAMRATDRIVRFGYYMIPLQHRYPTPIGKLEIAYWDKFGRPEKEATWNFPYYSLDTWWFDENKAARLTHGVHK